MDLTHPLLQDNEPAPFPASFPQLRRLDRAVLCPICKELFKAPVSIGCGHSFCSAVSLWRLVCLTLVYPLVPRRVKGEEVSQLS